MITLGRRGDLHARRQATAFLRSRDVVHKLFAEVAPRFKDRPGGYARIIKIGPRPGDSAEMAYLELVDEEYVAGAARGACDGGRSVEEPEAGAVEEMPRGARDEVEAEPEADAEEPSEAADDEPRGRRRPSRPSRRARRRRRSRPR